MAELAWEKPVQPAEKRKLRPNGERYKFLLGGMLLLAAVGYLIFSSTLSGARFFITVDEIVSKSSYVGQPVRLTGAVIGATIVFNPETGDLAFTIAHLPETTEDLAQALHEAVQDPTRTQLQVRMENQVMPDLLQNEAQAIMTGELGADGIFYATELNLKCPSRFEENAAPELQAEQP